MNSTRLYRPLAGFVLFSLCFLFMAPLSAQPQSADSEKQEPPTAKSKSSRKQKSEATKTKAEETPEQKPGAMTAETFSGLHFRLDWAGGCLGARDRLRGQSKQPG